MLFQIITFAGLAHAMPAPMSVSALLGSHIDIPAGLQHLSTGGFQKPLVNPSRGGRSICVSGTVPVQASSEIKNISADEVPVNQIALTNLVLKGFSVGAPEMTASYTTVNDTFNIGASLCVAANDTYHIPTTVQVLTHGVGFDRYYWDFAPGYSYVDAITEAGYVAFFYDRLGVGSSEHPDARIVQMSLQSEILQSITELLRKGSISNTTFDRIIGVGHSFGSGVTTGVNAKYPTTFNATVVTGTSEYYDVTQPAFSFGLNPTIASQSDPQRFGDLPQGYFCPETVQGMQLDFFRAPGFDGEVLAQAFAQRQTSSIGEMLGGGPVSAPADDYVRPVFLMNGENDWPFCRGNCSAPGYGPEDEHRGFYPRVGEEDFGSFLAPVAGHGVNLHFSAQEGYAAILEFLKQHGL